MTGKEITIILPVYGGADDLRSCVDSVIRHHRPEVEARLLIIDDASPGDEVARVLAALDATRPSIDLTIQANERNLGFAATVNRGLRSSAGDVVLLNSDTIVTDGWLGRLHDAARGPDVATVTPLTNEGSLATLAGDVAAAFGFGGPDPRVDEAAAFVAANALGLRPSVIAGVGFCMYITRHALDVVGELDEVRFGRGYGEEVDFCLRASALGLRHVIEDSTFVYHVGGASFGAESMAAKADASAVLHERHPEFRAANLTERRADPLAPVMAALRLALRPRQTGRPHVLHVLHQPSPYGGTEKHLDALIEALAPAIDASILTPSPTGFRLRTRWTTDDGTRSGTNDRELLLGGEPAALGDLVDPVAAEVFASVLALFDFDAVHLHNLIGHSFAPIDGLADFDGPVVATLHDYYLACPHHWLLYRNQVPCGIPDDLSICAACLPETRQLPVAALVEHRAAVADRLGRIDQWVFPSQYAADQLRRLYELDDERVHIIPHGSVTAIDPGLRTVDPDHVLDGPLRIAFVGRGWGKKGLGGANWLAAALADAPIEIHHFGEAREPADEHLIVHGAYDNRRLPHLLRAAGIHVVWLPGPYAETFGLVMTESLAAGLPLIGPTYGAIGERIRAAGVGWTVDPADLAGTRALVESLDANRFELLRATTAAATAALDTVAATVDRYAALYGAPGATARASRPGDRRSVAEPS